MNVELKNRAVENVIQIECFTFKSFYVFRLKEDGTLPVTPHRTTGLGKVLVPELRG